MFHDVEQGSEEWFTLRVGKLTGSNLSKVMANDGKAFGEPAKKLAVNIAIEQLTCRQSSNDSFSNEHTARGLEQEPIARMLYENEYFVDVLNGGFYDCGRAGVSPDGRVNDDGLIEIKSVLAHVHYATIIRQGIDPAYKWQVYFELLKSDREWIDFVSYCADFPERSKLFIHRTERKDAIEQFNMIRQREDDFFELVDSIKGRI